jgi:hypothetical protein
MSDAPPPPVEETTQAATRNLPPRHQQPVPADVAIWPNVMPHTPGLKTDIEPGMSLEDVAKKLFFVADDIGEPEVSRERNQVALTYPDDSTIRISFEQRPGRHGGTGLLPADEESAKNQNEWFKSSQDFEKGELERAKASHDVNVKGQKAKEDEEKTDPVA